MRPLFSLAQPLTGDWRNAGRGRWFGGKNLLPPVRVEPVGQPMLNGFKIGDAGDHLPPPVVAQRHAEQSAFTLHGNTLLAPIQQRQKFRP